MTKKIYRCYICNEIIKPENAVRFVKQLYNFGHYKQFTDIRRYDLCEECWWVVNDLFFKWKGKKQEGCLIKKQ